MIYIHNNILYIVYNNGRVPKLTYVKSIGNKCNVLVRLYSVQMYNILYLSIIRVHYTYHSSYLVIKRRLCTAEK